MEVLQRKQGDNHAAETHTAGTVWAFAKPTSACPAVLSCIQILHPWFLWAPAEYSAPSCFQNWKQNKPLCHPRQSWAPLTPGGKTIPYTSSKCQKTIVIVEVRSWLVSKDVPAGACCGEPWGPGPHYSGQGLVERTHSPHPACVWVSLESHIQVKTDVTRHVGLIPISTGLGKQGTNKVQSMCILNHQGLCFPRISFPFLSNIL